MKSTSEHTAPARFSFMQGGAADHGRAELQLEADAGVLVMEGESPLRTTSRPRRANCASGTQGNSRRRPSRPLYRAVTTRTLWPGPNRNAQGVYL